MAFVAPAVAALGAGSVAAGAITLASLGVGAYSAYQQHRAGQEQKAEAKAAATREADATRQTQIERRRELQRVFAVRAATAAAGGGGTGGSIAALTRRDIRDNRNDLLVSDVNSAARQRALRSSGRQAARSGNVAAISSLLDTAKTTYTAVGGR